MSIENTTVSSIMTRTVRTATENESIKSIANRMVENGIGSIVIVKQDNQATGMITERDIVREVALNHASSIARDVMSKPIITIEPGSSLRDAIQTMQAKGIRRLPVVENGQIVGIVTDKDIFRAIAKSQTLTASFLNEELLIEYRPTYEQLQDFMQSELLFPGRNQ